MLFWTRFARDCFVVPEAIRRVPLPLLFSKVFLLKRLAWHFVRFLDGQLCGVPDS